MSEIIKKNKAYLVKSEYGSYTINNKHSAEKLNQTLTDYETLSKQSQKTEQTLDRVQKQIIRIQMTASTLKEEINQIKQELEK